MEKDSTATNAGATSTTRQTPSAPPPSPPPMAPPSYEEAVGSIAATAWDGRAPTGTLRASSSDPAPSSRDVDADNLSARAPARTEVRIVRQPVPYALGPDPVKMRCPTCAASMKTSTVSQRQPSAHLCCIILCIFGCCLCSCLPYCMSAFLTVHHYCPSCRVYIGTWKG